MRGLGSPRNGVPEREQEPAERDMISPRTLWPDPLRLDQYPRGLLLWRSLTQWMGSLGIGPNPWVCVAPTWAGISRSCVLRGERVAANARAVLWSAASRCLLPRARRFQR